MFGIEEIQVGVQEEVPLGYEYVLVLEVSDYLDQVES